MTELEALAKDCIENHTHRLVDKPTKQDIYLREESIFIQGYRQSEKRIADLEAQIEKMKNQKVFLLQRVDTDDYTIDEQFYTTDEEIAKEWDKYYKPNYWYGQAIELEEFSDKERIREELKSLRR